MADRPSLIGQTISHYRVLERLGSGGMGIVYKAEDIRLHRLVALKFLPDAVANDPHALARFQREAEAASALNNPHICTIYDVGEDNGRAFIAMEYLEGQTLNRFIQHQPLATDQILDIAGQVADGLDAAHRKAIIHRDLKPPNIFVTTSGQAKILDFGLAKVVSRKIPGSPEMTAATTDTTEDELTSPGVAVGTVAYMSPEQVRGEKLDSRSDLFSFGVMLYEMATGRLAFPGNTPWAIIHGILNNAPASPIHLNPDLPVRLEEIINKALEKDANVRYQHTSEVRADLKRLKRDLDSAKITPSNSAQPAAPHAARAWLRSLVRPVSRAGRRFWIAFLLTCALVASLEHWFESVIDRDEYPGIVQTVFGITGIYQWLVTGVHFPYPRYTAIVAIDPYKEPKIPNNHQICEQRKVIGDLITRIHVASPSVIAVDKYFGPRYQCAETNDLRKAIESASRDTVVALGTRLDDNGVSTKAGDRNFLLPSVDFGIQSPRFQEGIVNLDLDTRKIPLRWEVYESKEQAEQSAAAPEWRNTFALQAALAYPGGLLQKNRRIASFVEHSQNPFTSFLKADDFEPILAGRILSGDVPGGTAKGPSEHLPEDLRRRFAGRVVLIGEIDHDLDDHLTVVGRMSGLLLQANYIEALLDDRIFRPVPFYLDYVFGFAILVGLELILILFRGKGIFLALALVGLFFCSLFVLFLLVKLLGWYVDPAPLSIIPVMAKILSSLFGRAEEFLSHQQRQKSVFARQ